MCIQRTQAAVAVGLEWAHAQLVGEGEGLAVVGFGLIAHPRLTLCCNLTEEAQGIGFVAPLLTRTDKIENVPGEVVGFFPATSPEQGFTQPDTPECMPGFEP